MVKKLFISIISQKEAHMGTAELQVLSFTNRLTSHLELHKDHLY